MEIIVDMKRDYLRQHNIRKVSTGWWKKAYLAFGVIKDSDVDGVRISSPSSQKNQFCRYIRHSSVWRAFAKVPKQSKYDKHQSIHIKNSYMQNAIEALAY